MIRITALLLCLSIVTAATAQTDDKELHFISFVLDDVQHNWDRTLPAQTGHPYHHTKLAIFRGSHPSGCGTAKAAVGPFYCPADEKVYLDLAFFDELRRRFGAPGEFARAYVIAHEIGHHVQKIMGKLDQGGGSVPVELQADCLAGVWANSTERREIVNMHDIDSALNAASAVGDDRLQRETRGYVRPETFTHGSSAQRIAAFRRGLNSGKLSACGIL